MTPRISEIWVYLAASPLLGLTLTLLAYQGATWVHKRCRGHPLANPVLLAVATLVGIDRTTGRHIYGPRSGTEFGQATAIGLPTNADSQTDGISQWSVQVGFRYEF